VRGVPSKEDDQSALIDVLQDWKSAHYQELVGEEPTVTAAALCIDRVLVTALTAVCLLGSVSGERLRCLGS